jgi:hypothetical protein
MFLWVTGAMLFVLILDGAGYLIAVDYVPREYTRCRELTALDHRKVSRTDPDPPRHLSHASAGNPSVGPYIRTLPLASRMTTGYPVFAEHVKQTEAQKLIIADAQDARDELVFAAHGGKVFACSRRGI